MPVIPPKRGDDRLAFDVREGQRAVAGEPSLRPGREIRRPSRPRARAWIRSPHRRARSGRHRCSPPRSCRHRSPEAREPAAPRGSRRPTRARPPARRCSGAPARSPAMRRPRAPECRLVEPPGILALAAPTAARKCSARSGMSSRCDRGAMASRWAGRSVGRRGRHGSVPASTSDSRSRFVVAMTLTSTVRVWLDPTRSKVRSWRTRRSFAWSSGGISLISSSSSVPPSASSNRPFRSLSAPVNAPSRARRARSQEARPRGPHS